MKEIGAIFVVSVSEIRTVKLAAIKRRYTLHFPYSKYTFTQKSCSCMRSVLFYNCITQG